MSKQNSAVLSRQQSSTVMQREATTSTLQERVRARLREKEERRKKEEGQVLQWGAGSFLTVKNRDSTTGWLLVKAEESVSAATVSSDSTFKSLVYRQTDNMLYLPTKPPVYLDVAPSDVIRPVELQHRAIPQATLDWIVKHHFLPKAIEHDINESSSSEEEQEGSEDEEDEADEEAEEDDDDEGRRVGAKRGRSSTARQPKLPKPKAKNAPKEPKPKAAKKVGEKRARASSASTKARKAKPEPLPFFETSPLLSDKSEELKPANHLEALRAALTDHSVLLQKVLDSDSHRPWLYCVPVPDVTFRQHQGPGELPATPMELILERGNPAMIETVGKYLAKNKLSLESVLSGMGTGSGMMGGGMRVARKVVARKAQPGGFGGDQPKDAPKLGSIFEQDMVPHGAETDSRVQAWGSSVAKINSSLLQKQGSGQASTRTFGHRIRNVSAGRGARELGNAFTSQLFVQHGDLWNAQWNRNLKKPGYSSETIRQLADIMKKNLSKTDLATMGLTTDDEVNQRFGLGGLDEYDYRHVSSFLHAGEAESALVALKKKGLNAGLETGYLHLLALDPTATGLPADAKNIKASIVKMGLDRATPLHYAAVNPNPTVLKAMIKELGALPQPHTDCRGYDIVHYAAASKTPEALKTLIAECPGIPLWTGAARKETPAHIAATLNRGENLAVLLQQQTDQQLIAVTQALRTPLLEAAFCGSADAVKAILATAATKDGKRKLMKQAVKGTGFSVLHAAARSGSVEVVKTLLDNGATIEVKDRHKRTPFLIAAKSGHLNVLSLLANRKAKTAAADSSANQAIHYAAAYGHLDCLEYLVEHCSSDVNAETSWKMTPFGLAILGGYSSTCGSYLLKKFGDKIDVNFRDDKYNTLLHTVLESDYEGRLPELMLHVKYLLDLKIDPTLAKADGTTALHILAKSTQGRTQRNVLNHYLSRLIAYVKQQETLAHSSQEGGLTQLAKVLESTTAASPAKMTGGFKAMADDGDAVDEEDEDDDEGSDNEGSDDDSGDDGDDDDGDDDDDEDYDDDDEVFDDDDEFSAPNRTSSSIPLVTEDAPLSYQWQHRIGELLRYANTNPHAPSNQQQSTIPLEEYKKEIHRVEEELKHPDVEIVLAKLLIDTCKDCVNSRDSNGQSPLLVALLAGNFEMVRFLLQRGADGTLVDSEGRTVIHHILAQPNPSTIALVDTKLFGAHIPKMLSTFDNDGMTPLQRLFAALLGQSYTGAQTAAAPQVRPGFGWRQTQPAQPAVDPAVDKAKKAKLIEAVIDLLRRLKPLAPECFGQACGPFVVPPRDDGTKPTNQSPMVPSQHVETHQAPLKIGTSFGSSEFEDTPADKLPPKPVKPYLTHHWYGGWTLLHFIAASNIEEAYAPLLASVFDEFEGDVKAKDIRGRTPLMIAVSTPETKNTFSLIVKPLLSNGSSLIEADEHGVTPLMRAISNGVSYVSNLLSGATKPELNAQDAKGRSALHRLAATRSEQLLLACLKQGGSANLADNEGRTPLHYSLSFARQSFSTFKFEQHLINAGADVNKKDSHGRTTLHYCFVDLDGKALGDPIEMVGSLIARYSNPKEIINTGDKDGTTALKLAVMCKSISCTLLLVAKGASVSHADVDGNIPLTVGLLNGATDVSSMLIQSMGKIDSELKVFDVSYKMDNVTKEKVKVVRTYSAGHYAMNKQWNGVVYLLIEAGFPRRAAMSDGLRCGLQDLCEGLLDKIPVSQRKTQLSGTDPTNGYTLLHSYAASSVMSPSLFEAFLKEGGCDVNAKDDNGAVPACLLTNFEKMKQFRTAGAHFNVADKHGQTVLTHFFHGTLGQEQRNLVEAIITQMGASPDFRVPETIAATGKGPALTNYRSAVALCLHRGDIKSLVMLIQRGASLQQPDSDGETLLMHAIRMRHQDALELLLRSGREIALNAVNSKGQSALHIAILINNTAAVEALAKTKGIDLNAKDGDGRTPLHYAVSPLPFGSYENVEILKCLLSKGANASLRDKAGFAPAEYTVPQSSKTLAAVFESFKVTVPPMSRMSSIVPDALWETSHSVVNPDEDSQAMVAKVAAEEQGAQKEKEEKPKPDSIYYRAKDASARDVTVVWSDHDVMMTKVDVGYGAMGLNMFYKFQVLHDTLRNVWILWTRYGRIGDEGQYQATPFSSAALAEKEFQDLFKKKTSNEWSMRTSYAKVAGKWHYHPRIEAKMSHKKVLAPFTEAELSRHKPHLSDQGLELLSELSDVTTMQQQHKMSGVEEDAFPLGRMPRETLEKALALIGKMGEELSSTAPPGADHMKAKQAKHERVAEMANAYYELVPHADFQYDSVAPPTNVQQVQQLWDKLKVMMDLENASRILIGARFKLDSMHPMDYVLAAMNVDLSPLRPNENDGAEFNALLQYFRNTEKNTRVHNIFRVQRKGEGERMATFCRGIDNRKLLWHGSSSTNFLPILSEGLRVAPPSAPVTGYAFGKGIYFADCASKSLAYAGRAGDSAIMLLCEVALGNSEEEMFANYRESLPDGVHSVKAFGDRAPMEGMDVVLNNGVSVPMGEVVSQRVKPAHKEKMIKQSGRHGYTGDNYALGQNEYIVFNAAQVRIRYLFQLKEDDTTTGGKKKKKF